MRLASLALAALFPFVLLLDNVIRMPAARSIRQDQALDTFSHAARVLSDVERTRVAPDGAPLQGSAFTETERHAFRVYVGSRFGAETQDASVWSRLEAANRQATGQRAFAEGALKAALAASPEERQRAEAVVARIIPRIAQLGEGRLPFWAEQSLILQGSLLENSFLVGLVSVLLAFVFRGPAVLRLLGCAVTVRGRLAPRWRVVWRSLLGWSPTLGWFAVPVIGTTSLASLAIVTVASALFLGGVAWTIFHPGRSIHDRLAGTRVVPV